MCWRTVNREKAELVIWSTAKVSMYIAQIGIVNAGDPKAAYDEAILFAMGHQCSYGLEAAGVSTACVAKAFEHGTSVDDIIETAGTVAKDGTKMAIEELTAAARSLPDEEVEMDQVIGTFQAIIEEVFSYGR